MLSLPPHGNDHMFLGHTASDLSLELGVRLARRSNDKDITKLPYPDLVCHTVTHLFQCIGIRLILALPNMLGDKRIKR